MKTKHKYSTDGKEEVQDLFCIEVIGVRQDSLYDQLKDLQLVADNIGCYDASDYLKGLVEKIDKKSKEQPRQSATVAICRECPDNQTQQDMISKKYEIVAGCNNLTKKEWNNKLIPCPRNGSRRII